MKNIISCTQYDYFEIACMHRYEIELTLKNGEIIIGIAHDVKVVKTHKARKEVLELTLKKEKMVTVELIEIRSMRAIKENPHFKEIQLIDNKIN